MDTENLSRVWSRVVNGASGVQEPSDTELGRLRQMITAERYDTRVYTLLSIKSRCHVFRELADSERNHEKRLQTEYILRTGDTYSPPRREPSAPYILTAVKRCRENEIKSEKLYTDAARETKDTELARLFTELAGEEREHEGRLREILNRLTM